MAAFIYLTASSMGMMLASLKKAACSTMLVRPPRPISRADLGGVAGVDVHVVLGDVALGGAGQNLAQLLDVVQAAVDAGRCRRA